MVEWALNMDVERARAGSTRFWRVTSRRKKALLSFSDSRAFARVGDRTDYGRPCAVLPPPDEALPDDDDPDELAALPPPADVDDPDVPGDAEPLVAKPSPLRVYPCPLTTRPCGLSPFTTTTGT